MCQEDALEITVAAYSGELAPLHGDRRLTRFSLYVARQFRGMSRGEKRDTHGQFVAADLENSILGFVHVRLPSDVRMDSMRRGRNGVITFVTL